MNDAKTIRKPWTRLVVLLAALALTAVACDDDGTPGDTDTGTMDTSGDTGGDDADTSTPEDTEDVGDDADTGTDTSDDTDTTPDDTEDADDTEVEDDTDTADADAVSCPATCPANAECDTESGECVCGPLFEDCDGDLADAQGTGCETNISVPEQCGGCGDMRDMRCERFGVVSSCVADGAEFYCPAACQDGYLDLDADATSENASNGCETGLVAGAAQDLSTELGATGDIVALDHDGTYLYALTEDGGDYTLHVLEVAGDGTVSSVASDPVGVGNGNASFAAATGGFVAVSATAQTVFYAYDGTTLTELESAGEAGAASVAALSAPQVTNSQAEFVAAIGDGIVWYGVFAQASDAPDSGTCIANGRVCVLGEQTQPLNTSAVAVADLGGAPWAVAMGDTTIDFEFVAATPELDANLTAGDSVPSTALDYEPLSDALAAVQDDGTVHVYEYTVAAGANPTARTDARTLTPDTGSATELEVLDTQRWLIGTDMGLLAVLLDDTSATQLSVDQPLTSVDALIVEGDTAYVATGQQLVLVDIDLGTLTP